MPTHKTFNATRRGFPRKARTLQDDLEHRLSAYLVVAATAGVALLASPEVAQANTIVYQQVNQTYLHQASISVSGATFSFTDFPASTSRTFFHIINAGANGGLFFNNPYLPLPRGFAIGRGGYYPYQGPVPSGYMGEIFGPLSQKSQFGFRGRFFSFSGYGRSGEFIGLMFDFHGQTHFGWVELKIPIEIMNTSAGPEAIPVFDIISFAYNRVPNARILAGQTSNNSIPEPSTLALLALGAAGLPIWRKKAAKSRKA